MPIMPCNKDGKSGWKYGANGTCFTESNGKTQAEAQGRAIEARKTKDKKDKKGKK